MLTFRLGLYQREEKRALELVNAIKRNKGCCDTVWLCTMGYYPTIEKHEEYAKSWVKSAKIFRDAGIKVSLQINNTIGHCDNEFLKPEYKSEFCLGMMPSEGEDDPYLVGHDGTKNISCFCWRSQKFKNYVNKMIQTYAKVLKPTTVWFDDDLRAHSHSPNKFPCYCDRCISEFNKEQGTNYTRQELVEKMNYKDLSLRKAYLNFIKKGIYNFVYGAVKACLEVAPDTTFALEYEHLHNYLGPTDEHILGAMHDASGKAVETRPGGGCYNDKDPYSLYYKLITLSAPNSILPPYVNSIVAEIENLPGVAFGKSIGGILNEGTLDLAIGCTGLSFTDVQSCHEPIEYYEKIFAGLKKMRPYWERLSTVAKEGYRGSISIYWGKEPHLKSLNKQAPPFSWDYVLNEADVNLMRLGVPLSYDSRGDIAYILHNKTVDSMTDSDIEFLLTKPVITDGICIEKLIKRGFKDRFNFTTCKIGSNTTEYFTDAFGKEYLGRFYKENPYASKFMQRYIFNGIDSKTTTVYGNAHNCNLLSDGKKIGATTIVTNINGTNAKWAIFGYSVWADIVSSAKRNQILAMLDDIAKMPARLISDEICAVIPSVNKEGFTTAVTVSSMSQNGTSETLLEIRNPCSKNLSIMGTRHNSYEFSFVKKGSKLLVTLPKLDPYETITIFIE